MQGFNKQELKTQTYLEELDKQELKTQNHLEGLEDSEMKFNFHHVRFNKQDINLKIYKQEKK